MISSATSAQSCRMLVPAQHPNLWRAFLWPQYKCYARPTTPQAPQMPWLRNYFPRRWWRYSSSQDALRFRPWLSLGNGRRELCVKNTRSAACYWARGTWRRRRPARQRKFIRLSDVIKLENERKANSSKLQTECFDTKNFCSLLLGSSTLWSGKQYTFVEFDTLGPSLSHSPAVSWKVGADLRLEWRWQSWQLRPHRWWPSSHESCCSYTRRRQCCWLNLRTEAKQREASVLRSSGRNMLNRSNVANHRNPGSRWEFIHRNLISLKITEIAAVARYLDSPMATGFFCFRTEEKINVKFLSSPTSTDWKRLLYRES